MKCMRNDLNTYEQFALSRLTLNDQKDAAATAAEKADIQQWIDNIGKQIKKVTKNINTAIFITYDLNLEEEENSNKLYLFFSVWF